MVVVPRRAARPIALLFAALTAAAPLAAQQAFPPWSADREAIEERLTEAAIRERVPVSRGVTQPWRLTLDLDGQEIRALWKPLRSGYHSGYWESWQGEVMAYRLDRWLGLEMVPPTVERTIGAVRGSLQYWVDGFRMFEEVQDRAPGDARWNHQLARMKFFDALIHNRDRNAGNFLVDDDWNIVLIDHSRAILHERKPVTGPDKLPSSFDRTLVERLRQLDAESAEKLLGGLLTRSQIKSLLKRGERLLEYVAECEAERGTSIWFD